MRRLSAALLTVTAACGLAAVPAAAATADPAGSTPAVADPGATVPDWTLDAVDSDGDGLVAPHEFTRAWVMRGGNPSEAQGAFQITDLDGNGYLCRQEFPAAPLPEDN